MDKCSFCGRPRKETRILIQGNSGFICDDCVSQAQQILAEEVSSPVKKHLLNKNY